MADDDTTREGVLLPTAVTDDGELQGVYLDQHGARRVQVSHSSLGKPGSGVMNLAPRDGEHVFDAKIVKECSEPANPGHKGPARVSTPAYKDGWARIWGPEEPAEA